MFSYLKNLFSPSSLIEWNTLDLDKFLIVLSAFKISLLWFISVLPDVFLNSAVLRVLICLQKFPFGVSHPRKYTLDLFSNQYGDIKSKARFFCYHSMYPNEKTILTSTLKNLVTRFHNVPLITSLGFSSQVIYLKTKKQDNFRF